MDRPIIGARYKSADGELVEVYAVSADYVCVFSTRQNEIDPVEREYHREDFDRFFSLNDSVYGCSESGTEL